MYYSDLADLIRQKMSEKNFSTYDIARRSGNKINANTITRILNGNINEAKLSTLAAIAEALEMSVEDVVRVSQGKSIGQNIYEQLAEHFNADDLDVTEWQFLMANMNDMIHAFREGKKQFEQQIHERFQQQQSKVAATITPAVDRAEVQKMIDEVPVKVKKAG